MPERLANTDPFQQVTEMIGSGPFKFVKEEFQPGHLVVYVKNKDYVPRKEPPSWASGGKVVKVDRVEWLYIPDAMTKVAALNNNEADWWENPPADVWPVLAANPGVTVARVDPLSSPIMVRFNHVQPPFDNPKMRQAVLSVVDQGDFLAALAGDEANWERCASFFTCGSPMANDSGAAAAMPGKPDFDKAKKLIAGAGYKGERVVVMDAVDQPVAHTQALVVTELLKKLGINVDLQAMDWGTLVTRRASKEPIDKGGWNLFHTWTAAPDMLSPALNIPLRANGEKAWFGWPTDAKLEALIDAWFKASDPTAQKKLAEEIQVEVYTGGIPYIPTGQFLIPTAYRKNLDGIIIAPVVFLWNVEKK
jgi:peptide/nickel transport system substrate-binding protein